MKDSLLKNLEIIRANKLHPDAGALHFGLYCGFTPLWLKTFFHSTLCMLAESRRVTVHDGIYGDILGALRSLLAEKEEFDSLAVVIEWEDLDARLGLRSHSGWDPSLLEDMLSSVQAKLRLLAHAIHSLAEAMPIVVALPTLPLLPLNINCLREESEWSAGLKREIAFFAASLAARKSIRLLNNESLTGHPEYSKRYNANTHLTNGFPFTNEFAALLARELAFLAHPPVPLKGLIFDLDDTLWRGVLGEDGVEGVSWDLNHGSQIYAVFQAFLQSLARSGVLLAIASKNDQSLVEELFSKKSPLVARDSIFPLMANWGKKSISVQKILKIWNIDPASVVFVDDSPLEIEEVQLQHPRLQCLLFPKQDAGLILGIVRELRDLFGKRVVTEEDAIRLRSLRMHPQIVGQAASDDSLYEDLLRNSDPSVLFHNYEGIFDDRAFELINKTNQFNMNGERCGEVEWRRLLEEPGAFLVTATYKDKFGPLGKIAVARGYRDGKTLVLTHWVMSCRAFGRRIEYILLHQLFETYDAEMILFRFSETPKNAPFKLFLESLGALEGGTAGISRTEFLEKCPALYHSSTS